VTGGYLSITAWFNEQQTKIIIWVTGGYLSISKWFDEQEVKVKHFIFGEGGNIEKYTDEQTAKLSAYTKNEDIITLEDIMDFLFEPVVPLPTEWEEKGPMGPRLVAMYTPSFIAWIIDNAKNVPDLMSNLVDAMAGSIVFEEEVPPPVKTPEERAQDYRKLFLKDKKEFLEQMRKERMEK
jgi:hypothetical protein